MSDCRVNPNKGFPSLNEIFGVIKMTKKIENPGLVKAFRDASAAALAFTPREYGCRAEGLAIAAREAAWKALLQKGGGGDFNATRSLRFCQKTAW